MWELVIKDNSGKILYHRADFVTWQEAHHHLDYCIYLCDVSQESELVPEKSVSHITIKKVQ